MPGPLRNSRHEAFVRGLFENKTAHQSYIDAGYKPCRQNAARLTTKDDIKQRLAELQNEAAEQSVVTVESLLGELEHARKRADSLDQLAASVKAISEKARISGLLTQKIEVGSPGSFEAFQSPAELAEHMLQNDLNFYHDVREEDYEGLALCIADGARRIHEFLDAIKARPPLPSKGRSQRLIEQQRPFFNGGKREI
jgi:phage terminase small subunit